MDESYKYIFGPVLSGRLGRSLGLDLLGGRICSMNCVYCESGPLATLTLKRAPYVPAAALLDELARWEAARAAKGEARPDVITLGGLGEPTLNSDLPRIIAGVRRIAPGVPVAVLTNASLMTDETVRGELLASDIVLPSLDSLLGSEFAAVNRPHPGLNALDIAEGIRSFRARFAGRVWLEVLLVAGVNDSAENLDALELYCRALAPHRVDVVTLSRPGTEDEAKAVDAATLTRWRERLAATATRSEPAAQATEALAYTGEKRQGLEDGAVSGPRDTAQLRAALLASLTRRPQTAGQLAQALLVPEQSVHMALEGLLAQGEIAARQQDGATYFQARAPRP